MPEPERNLCLPFNGTGLMGFIVVVQADCKGVPLDLCGWGTFKLRGEKILFRGE